jgi:hypothetical protein
MSLSKTFYRCPQIVTSRHSSQFHRRIHSCKPQSRQKHVTKKKIMSSRVIYIPLCVVYRYLWAHTCRSGYTASDTASDTAFGRQKLLRNAFLILPISGGFESEIYVQDHLFHFFLASTNVRFNTHAHVREPLCVEMISSQM